jgi:hypothetical protein
MVPIPAPPDPELHRERLTGRSASNAILAERAVVPAVLIRLGPGAGVHNVQRRSSGNTEIQPL